MMIKERLMIQKSIQKSSEEEKIEVCYFCFFEYSKMKCIVRNSSTVCFLLEV